MTDRNFEVYDTEIFPNLFTVCFKPILRSCQRSFEISERRDQRDDILGYVHQIDRMIGFNNLGFDWLLIKALIDRPLITVYELYELADSIIKTDSRFGHIDWNPSIEQLDLMRLHHFDNRAKMTSLKTLEFNMRMRSIRDLPFAPGTYIPRDGIDVVLSYNGHDVTATERFFYESIDKVEFREALNPKWINFSDSKIGKQYFIDALAWSGIECFEFDDRNRRRPRQTPREDGVALKDIIFPWIAFKRPELVALLDDLKEQTIFDTLGSFERKFELDDVPVSFGLGGLHGSVKRRKYTTGTILDLDVTSYYPSIAIVNRVYPEHLGEKFCDVYEEFFERRKKTEKGSGENAALKLGLNSVFGDSNNPYGPFFDPAYMLTITINGQLMLLMLAEELLDLKETCGLEIIQLNTDGVTIRIEDNVKFVREVADMWQVVTGMNLEEKQYKHLFIRDVNNYIGEFTDEKRKRKGVYEYEREWHQNHSGLVIPKGAEAVLLNDADPELFVAMHPDTWDFMFRVKTNVNSHISFDSGREMKGTIRYYLSEDGENATKHMPKTTTRLHASGFSEPEGKRGDWKCPECGFKDKRKADVKAHIEACHASKLVVCQEYEGEPIPIDVRPYVSAINELTRDFS